jgi:hypothetical protein
MLGIEPIHIGGAVLVGIGATVIMDIWNLFLRHAFDISSLNFCFVGRWLSHMLTGTFAHANISAAPKRPAECAIGWTAHYLIGIAFALLLVLVTYGSWLESPSLLQPCWLASVPCPFRILLCSPPWVLALLRQTRPIQLKPG